MTTKTSKTKAKSLKLSEENPFYGKRAMLDMMQQVSKMTDKPNKRTVFNHLDKAWAEATTQEAKELFFVLIFAFGDVVNRDHNLLVKEYGKGKFEQGGNSLRRVFTYAMEWLVEKDPKQFYKFLPIISEYTNLENSFLYQLRTNRKTGKVEDVISIVPEDRDKRAKFIEEVSDFLAAMIRNVKTSPLQHQILAKFLPKPKFSKRKRTFKDRKSGEMKTKKANLQKETVKKEMFEKELMTALSAKLKWEVIQYPHNTRFIGLEQYKAKHNKMTEAYLFSTKKVLEMDEAQFHKWLDQLPAGARFRVQRRLLSKEGTTLTSKGKWKGKYGDLAKFYQNWLAQKEKANDTVRELEAKAKTGKLSDKEADLLKKATKDAKVNTGAESLLDMIADLYKNTSDKEFDVKVDNLLRKVDVKVPVMVIADVSGSMSSRSVDHKGVSFSAMDMARLAATVFLTKNPDPDLQQLLVTFDNQATIITDKTRTKASSGNRFLADKTVTVDKLVDPAAKFSDNYKNVSQFIFARGGTDLTSVVKELKRWVDEVPGESQMRKELINKYPVWLVVSDGDLNHMGGATGSAADFMHKMKMYFGWNGVCVFWDVKAASTWGGDEQSNKFEGIENAMYYGSCNPQALNQIFCNIDDLDIIDVYQPLLSMHRSNRYDPVKELVIKK